MIRRVWLVLLNNFGHGLIRRDDLCHRLQMNVCCVSSWSSRHKKELRARADKQLCLFPRKTDKDSSRFVLTQLQLLTTSQQSLFSANQVLFQTQTEDSPTFLFGSDSFLYMITDMSITDSFNQNTRSEFRISNSPNSLGSAQRYS